MEPLKTRKVTIDKYFFTQLGFYFMHVPVFVPYESLKVLHVAGEFFEYIPPQTPNFHLTYRMLRNDFPGMKNIYNYYDKTSSDLAVLKILFQV
jgi:hypothetical protein